MTLTAKEKIVFTFGEVEGGYTFANVGDTLELVQNYMDTALVKNKDGEEAVIEHRKLQFS